MGFLFEDGGGDGGGDPQLNDQQRAGLNIDSPIMGYTGTGTVSGQPLANPFDPNGPVPENKNTVLTQAEWDAGGGSEGLTISPVPEGAQLSNGVSPDYVPFNPKDKLMNAESGVAGLAGTLLGAPAGLLGLPLLVPQIASLLGADVAGATPAKLDALDAEERAKHPEDYTSAGPDQGASNDRIASSLYGDSGVTPLPTVTHAAAPVTAAPITTPTVTVNPGAVAQPPSAPSLVPQPQPLITPTGGATTNAAGQATPPQMSSAADTSSVSANAISRQASAKARGRISTILTSPLGVTSRTVLGGGSLLPSPFNELVGRKTLLGQ